jgi:hypothetical protein
MVQEQICELSEMSFSAIVCLPISLTYVFYFLVTYCNKIKNIIFKIFCTKKKMYFKKSIIKNGNTFIYRYIQYYNIHMVTKTFKYPHSSQHTYDGTI